MKYDFDVAVIGGGAAGLVSATGSAMLGAKTALIEKNKLGGDCTWYGCIPSKALLRSAQVFYLLKRLNEFGISAPGEIKYDPKFVMPHVRGIVARISARHPPELFEKRGIRVLFGNPRFLDNKTLELNGAKIFAKRFIICTGSQAMIPPIEGLKNISYLTNENVFDLESLPKSLIVLGGGPIGIELSQAFGRLGVEVSIVEMLDRLLFREEEEASKILADNLKEEGIKIYTAKKAVRFLEEGRLIAVTLEDRNNQHSVIKAEKILVAVGRVANVKGLDLEKAGVEYNEKGIRVGPTLRTTAKNIYAAGDVAGPYQFSHMAEYQAIMAVSNALFPFKGRVNYNSVPWCTFTDPEVAHLGLTEEEARKKYKNIKIYKSSYSENDRAVTDLEEKGFAKVVVDRRGRILGAHIVGAGAGDLIHGYVLAKSSGLKISSLSSAIHIYPTLSQVVKRSADQYYSSILRSKWFILFSKAMLKLLH